MRMGRTEIKKKRELTVDNRVKKGFVEELSLAWVHLKGLEIQQEEQEYQPKVIVTKPLNYAIVPVYIEPPCFNQITFVHNIDVIWFPIGKYSKSIKCPSTWEE